MALSAVSTTSGAATAPDRPSSPSRTPCRSSRAARGADAIARGDRGRQAPDPFGRLSATRDAPGRQRHRGPARRRSGRAPAPRRRTSRSPGATAIGADKRRMAAAAPSGRSIASRPLRPTTPSTAAVPRWTRARARSGSGAASRTRIRSLARTAGSSVRTRPRWRSRPSMPARLSAIRPGSARARPWTRGPGPRGRGRTGRPARAGASFRPRPGRPRSVTRSRRATTLDREDPIDRQA